jgi:hypothetical protein
VTRALFQTLLDRLAADKALPKALSKRFFFWVHSLGEWHGI